jgi:hypothetical protein
MVNKVVILRSLFYKIKQAFYWSGNIPPADVLFNASLYFSLPDVCQQKQSTAGRVYCLAKQDAVKTCEIYTNDKKSSTFFFARSASNKTRRHGEKTGWRTEARETGL